MFPRRGCIKVTGGSGDEAATIAFRVGSRTGGRSSRTIWPSSISI